MIANKVNLTKLIDFLCKLERKNFKYVDVNVVNNLNQDSIIFITRDNYKKEKVKKQKLTLELINKSIWH